MKADSDTHYQCSFQYIFVRLMVYHSFVYRNQEPIACPIFDNVRIYNNTLETLINFFSKLRFAYIVFHSSKH